MADETTVKIENGDVTAAAAAGANVAAVAAGDAVKTATELAADRERVLAEETRLYRDGIAKTIGEYQEDFGKWRGTIENSQTALASTLTENLTATNSRLETLATETAAALAEMRERLTPPKSQETPPPEVSSPGDLTKTEHQQKSGDVKPEAQTPKRRIVRKI